MSRIEPECDGVVPSEVTALLERAIAGDISAFETIVKLHERRVLMLSWRLLGNLEDAQDSAQEVFLRAYKYLHRLNTSRPVEAWLVRITINVCRDFGRQRHRRQKLATEYVRSEISDSNPFADAESGEKREMLRHAIAGLPHKERAAFVLRDRRSFDDGCRGDIEVHGNNGPVSNQHCACEDPKSDRTNAGRTAMTCRYSEEYLALYVEGELSQSELQAVERHVESCIDCSGIATALRESQKAIKLLRSESVNSGVLSHVHQQVMDQLGEPCSRAWWIEVERILFAGFRWKYALAGFAGLFLIGAIALGVLLQLRMPSEKAVLEHHVSTPVQSAEIVTPSVSRSLPVSEVRLPSTSRVVRIREATPKAAKPEAPPVTTMVKLYTDDPNIVIYWALDGNGETK